jgi:hypothetical protein
VTETKSIMIAYSDSGDGIVTTFTSLTRMTKTQEQLTRVFDHLNAGTMVAMVVFSVPLHTCCGIFAEHNGKCVTRTKVYTLYLNYTDTINAE